MLTDLRIINVIVYGALFLYMVPGAWSASFGRKHARYGDPMRLAAQAISFVMVGFNLRWLLIPEDQSTWAALYVLSAAVAVYIAYLARSYGRGPKL